MKNMPELTEVVTLLATGCQYQTADSMLSSAALVTTNTWSWSQEWRVEQSVFPCFLQTVSVHMIAKH